MGLALTEDRASGDWTVLLSVCRMLWNTDRWSARRSWRGRGRHPANGGLPITLRC